MRIYADDQFCGELRKVDVSEYELTSDAARLNEYLGERQNMENRSGMIKNSKPLTNMIMIIH